MILYILACHKHYVSDGIDRRNIGTQIGDKHSKRVETRKEATNFNATEIVK